MENNMFAKGKRAPENRPCVKFGDFLLSMPTAPLVDMPPTLIYPMDGNDRVGCCVVAGWDHYRQVVTQLLTGTGLNFTQDEIWAFYKTQNPDFDPNGTPATNGPSSQYDNGMSIQAFLEYLVENKYILGFAKIDHTNEQEMKAATYLGLAIITGVLLDTEQMQQYQTGVWDTVPNGTKDGGHCIPLVGYVNTPDSMACVTWGKIVNCTQNFINNQMDEAWFVLTQYHVDHPNFRNNFDLAGFSTAVSQITEGQIIIPIFSQVLRLEMHTPEVATLQTLLGIPSDGIFGMKTQLAVMLFQAKHGLVSDGVVGPKTMAALATMPFPPKGPEVVPTVGDSTVALISQFEGFSAEPYQDQGGVWTIGYGAIVDGAGNPVTATTQPITMDEAKALLKTQLQGYGEAVSKAVRPVLTQNQYDACVSLCYNIGIGGFTSSTVVRDINTDNFPAAADAFLLWDKVDGQVNQGLLNRRNKERALFIS